MSISSYTTVTMLDSRPAQITISVPKSTDIMNRIITFKDLFGSSSNSTIILVTRSGDTFEDGTFSTIMSNAYQTVNLYAGQPGKWLNIGSTGGGGGDSAGLTTVSNNLNTVSNTVAAGRFPFISATTISTNFIVASNISVASMSTTYGFFSTISTGSVFGRHIGDGSLLTNLPIARIPSTLSTLAFFTSSISTANITSQQGYISSLVVDSLAFSFSNSFIVMGDIITTSVSTIQTFTSTLTTNNLRVGTVSSLSFISFPGLQQGYAQTALAEQSTGTGLQELLVFRGSSASDRIRMQTTGSIVFEPGVSARVFPAVGSNVTPAMIINTNSNVGIGTATPGVSLDVVGAGRFTTVSTNTLSTNQVNSGNICNAGWISNNGIFSNITAGAFFQNTSNTGTLGVGGILTAASNITQTAGTTVLAGLSVNTISTNTINGNMGSFTGISTNTISTNSILADNISSYSIVAENGTFSTFGSLFSYSETAIAQQAYMSSLFIDTILTLDDLEFITMGNVVTNSISTQQIYVSSISSGSVYGKFFGDGSSLTGLAGGLPISTNNTTLTDPASIIIKTPNTSYFYEDYTNLTNYITISNYGAVNGDYINIVNTGNSGAPATFQILDGSTGASTIIRYIYPGHAGVVAYSSGQWWPL
jgi:hypothetical protein